MKYLDEIVNDIHAIEETIFKFDKELENTMSRIENINFIGQVDHNTLYMTMLHQIRDDCTMQIHTLTEDEAEEYYLTGSIKGWSGFRPFAWTLWFFNMDKDYIRALVSFNVDPKKTSKDNYGVTYNDLRPDVVTKIPRKMVYETTISNSGYAEIWSKLKIVIHHAKNNLITTGNFCKKIHVDTAKYHGEKKGIDMRDDEYKETSAAEIIRIPVKHKPQDMRYDEKLLKILRGTSFKQIDFEGDGYIKVFDTFLDLHSYLYSLIDYINTGVEKEYLDDQYICMLEKHFKSNKLGFESSDKYYKLNLTKFLGKLVIEAEIAELGVYYTLTNFNGKIFCELV